MYISCNGLLVFSEMFTIPLPSFSTFVEESLSSGRVLNCFSNLLAECAHFYINTCPLTTSGQYREVGEQLFQRFPCIKFSKGTEPWVCIESWLKQI